MLGSKRSQIRQVYQGIDAEAPDSRSPEYTSVVSALCDEVMQEIHGPLWKRGVGRAGAAGASGRVGSRGTAAQQVLLRVRKLGVTS